MSFRPIGADVDGASRLRASWGPSVPFPESSGHAFSSVLSIAASSVSALSLRETFDALARDVSAADPGESAVRGTQRAGLLAVVASSRRPSRSSTTEQ